MERGCWIFLKDLNTTYVVAKYELAKYVVEKMARLKIV